jgi:hypothetical protein
MALLPDELQHGVSLNRGHLQVQEDEVRGVVRDQVYGLGPPGGRQVLETERTEVRLEQLQNRGFVVEDENAFWGGGGVHVWSARRVSRERLVFGMRRNS